MSGNTALSKASIAIFAAGLCLLLLPGNARAYSVMAHEAIIDACWDPAIKPLLLARYPNSTPEQLAEARSYAYGGSIIQDLGYYPFGSFFFTHLLHYVRSGDFVSEGNVVRHEAHRVTEALLSIGSSGVRPPK